MSERRPVEDLYPLSPMQQGMLVHTLAAPRSGMYLWQVSCLLAGDLDVPAFRAALAQLVARHAVLRTSFAWEGLDQPLQMVERSAEPPLVVADWSALAPTEQEARLSGLLREDLERGFDLTRPPLTRLLLARCGEDRHRLVWTTHLLLVDGWSMTALIRELFLLYAGDHRLPAPRRYRDYIAWLMQQDAAAPEAFWRRELAGFKTPTPLPGLARAGGLAHGQRPRAAEVKGTLGRCLTAAVEALARGHRVTVNTVLQGAWSLVLAAGSGSRDVVFGSTVSGRPPQLPGVESMIGLFINTLPVRVRVEAGAALGDWLGALQQRTAQARQLEHTPLAAIQSWSEAPHGEPLFESILVFENYPVEGGLGAGRKRLEIRDVRLVEITNYPLTLEVVPGEAMALTLAYHAERLDGVWARRLLGHLEGLLCAMAAAPHARVGELSQLSAAERHQLLVEHNDTARPDAPADVPVHQWIAHWAAAAPEALAVAGPAGELTFAALDLAAGRLASSLRAKGVGPEAVVGVCLGRSPEALVAMVAVLKAGAALLPMDPSHPAERLSFMTEAAQARLVLTSAEVGATHASPSPLPGEACLAPTSSAYVLFTSGSTGRPKGVVVSHRALANHAAAMAERLGLGPGDRVLQFASPGFDVALEEVFATWRAGAAVVPAPDAVLASPGELTRFALEANLTVVNLPASYWQEWTRVLAGTALPPRLRRVVTGSERVAPDAWEAWRGREAGLLNAYGVTEGTITSLVFSGEAATSSVPVGRPIGGVQAHVLGDDLTAAALGEPGEIVLAGAGLARGYLGDARATAERFLPDPFASAPGARMYRTGDLARRGEDGAIEVLGRLDQQVKVRGVRIEPGEVEAVLRRHPAVAAVAVDAIEGGARLAAWVVAEGEAPTLSALRRFAKAELPEALLPSELTVVPALPLLPSGKVDRKALPAPKARESAAASPPAAPGREIERRIAAVWQEVLGRPRVGLDESFFDAGGHSLLLFKLQTRLQEALGRELALVDLFRFPTVRSLAGFLSPEPPQEAARQIHPQATGDSRIAIVGMAGRFPGAAGVEAFWDNLRQGIESIATFAEADLLASGVDPALAADPRWVRRGGVLDEIELFDADLFAMTPRDAELLDPQQRLFLESSWEALEEAGYDPAGCPGKVGVFAGASMSAYLRRLLASPEIVRSAGHYKIALGNDKDHLTTLVSYKLDLKGPSVAVQTACSTSLVAVHMACRALLAGECTMALAGGVSIQLPQRAGYLYQEGGIRAPDGHCRAFDAAARGTVAGSGVGVVVLKRLADALADGDPVRAVILGSAVNNDGAVKVGYTAPGVDGQAEVVGSALAAAGVDPGSIGYVEAHGTGTALGDPIEVAALARAFGPQPPGRCALGSVKTNIGHLDAAAGVAGLIKAALTVERGEIPPSLHFTSPNPQIDFAETPFYVNAALASWEGRPEPRRAGVSAFGIGGTNAHVVLEAPPAAARPGEGRSRQLLTLSARTADGLQAAVQRLSAALAKPTAPGLGDAAYTLHVGRRAFAHRGFAVCDGAAGTVSGLDFTCEVASGEPPVVFLFPGQGAQRSGMARDLYRAEPVFAAELDRAKPVLGNDLPALLDADDERLAATETAQPLLFAVEHALARLWMSWGVRPAALLGHSLGEYVAACIAGVFSFEEGLELVADRGRMIAELPRQGGMASLPLSEAETAALLTPGLAVAAVNGPAQCVVAGDEEELEALVAGLAGRGIEGRRLRTSHAFHSPLMEPVLARLEARVRALRLAAPEIPYASNLTGTWVTAEEATDPACWARHLRQTVRFGDGLATVSGGEAPVLLEVGPGRTLAALARRHPAARGVRAVVPSLPRPGEAGGDAQTVLTALGRLWASGVAVDWKGFHAGERRRRVQLPATPFERRRFWIDERPAEEPPAPAAAARRDPREGFYVPYWKPSPRAGAAAPERAQAWLILADADGLGELLAERLAARGVTATLVPVSTLTGREDYDRLFTTVLPDRVIHLGGCAEDAPLDEGLERCFWSLLWLAQSLGERRREESSEIIVVTRGAHPVRGGAGVVPAYAAAVGLSRVIPREFPKLACRHIDLVPGRWDADRLAAEVLAASGERTVALDGAERFVQRFEPVRLEATAKEAGLLRERGVYLITGGMGGIGLALAEHLAAEVGARLVLVGRSPLLEQPAPSAGLLEPGEAEELRRRAGELRRELGVQGRREALDRDLDLACAVRLAGFLEGSGIAVEGGVRYRVEELRRRLRLLPRFHRFLDFILRVLAEEGWAEPSGDEVVLRRGPHVAPPVSPDLAAVTELLDFTVARYGAALSGEEEASAVLFTEGGPLAAAEAAMARYSHERVAVALAAEMAVRLARRRPGATLRVLEVGAGQGRLTRPVAARLASEEGVEYWFTDLSRRFVLDAEREAAAAGLDFVRFATLDVARDPQPQGFAPESFDLILGLNVVHATADVVASLANLAGLLRPGGGLMLLETVLRERWVDMVWGLAHGWWSYADDLRQGSPLLDAAGWAVALERAGLSVETALAGAGADVALLVASRPGGIAAGDRAARVRRLESLGSEVLTVAADAADPAGLRRAFALAAERFGRVDGVIAAAGVPGGGMIELRTRESLAQELAVKLQGTVALGEICREAAPDFLAVCSSQSSFAGQFGQAGYCAANAFVDAWAHRFAAETGIPTVAVNWDRWRGVGMAVAVERQHRALTGEELAGGLDPAAGRLAWSRALASGLPQVVVSVEDFSLWLERFHAVDFGAALAQGGPGPAAALHQRPAMGVAFVAPADGLEARIAGLWQEVFGIEPIGAEDDFFALGGDSLVAVQLIARLAREAGVELRVKDLFEHPTIRGLAGRVEEMRSSSPGGEPAAAPLVRRRTDGPQPVSFAQRRLWFLDQLEPGGAAYNLPAALRLAGGLDVPALAASVAAIVRRHEILRTTFVEIDGEPAQLVGPEPAAALPMVDLSALPRAVAEAVAAELATAEARRPFDLGRGPVLRAGLLRLAADLHVALLTLHHIAADDRSVGVFVRELGAGYASCREGRTPAFEPLPIQYADYAREERERSGGEETARQLAYWLAQLAAPRPVLDLPADRPRPPVQSHRGGHRGMVLGPPLARGLRALARERGASLFMALLAGLDALLARLTGQEDILVGSPVTRRTRVETEDLIGFFVNALVLRTDLSGDPSFTDLVGRAREVALAAFAHQDVPFERLVEALDPERDRSRPPLFQVMLVVQGSRSAPTLTLPGLAVSLLPVETATARTDLGIEVWDTGEALVGQLEFNADLFDGATVVRLAEGLQSLLAAAVADPERRLWELPLLPPAARHQLVAEWAEGDPAAEDGLIHELVRERAASHPEAPAAVLGDEVLTYGGLVRRAGRLADRLRALAVGPEARVALLVDRSFEALIGMLGILEAGACYVPLDPGYPGERLALMAEDSGAVAVVAQEQFAPALAGRPQPVLLVDAGETESAGETGAAGTARATGDNAAYVIYTSGSLGRPKGVVVPHRALAGFARSLALTAGLQPGDRMLLFAPLAFDASALQIFAPLAAGATVVIEPDSGRLSPREIAALCVRQRVTVLDLPAAVWRQWIDEMAESDERILPEVRLFLTGGESLPADKLRSWSRLPAAPEASLLVSYGPTEATVTTTVFTVAAREAGRLAYAKAPLGRPLPGARVELLDRRGNPVPVGVTGEIHIAGSGVARGYQGKPEATAAAFLPAERATEPGLRGYRTGDLARYLPDGQLEFLGRADHQVKIRGFRVELGEIEALLAAFPGVKEAVVEAREEPPAGRRLVAYLLVEPGAAPPAVTELRSFLARALPEFMLPAAFVALPELPLLPSGKLDRRALPSPDDARPDLQVPLVAPRTPLERVLTDLWRSVLGVEEVGVHDDFFALGGHSLLATQLVSRLRQTLQVELPLRRLFESPTVAGLAAALADHPERARLEKTAELLVQLAALSEDEVETMLASEEARP